MFLLLFFFFFFFFFFAFIACILTFFYKIILKTFIWILYAVAKYQLKFTLIIFGERKKFLVDVSLLSHFLANLFLCIFLNLNGSMHNLVNAKKQYIVVQ